VRLNDVLGRIGQRISFGPASGHSPPAGARMRFVS
jgi:hypothetical protein